MSNEYLRKAAEEVRQHLEGVFEFESHPECRIYDIRDPEGQEFVEMVNRDARRPVDFERLGRTKDAMCLYVENALTNEGEYSVLVLSGPQEEYGYHLGEEMTCGEHSMEHAMRVGGYENYNRVFSAPFRSMMGALGMLSYREKRARETGKGVKVAFSGIPPDPSLQRVSNFVGYSFAFELFASGQVPYRELFHAESQEEGWDILKRVVRPTVMLTMDELVAGREALSQVFGDIGFIPHLAIVVRLRRETEGGWGTIPLV